MTKTTRRQFQQHVNRQRVKQRTEHEDNTVKGAQKSIDNDKHHEEIDDDQCCVVDSDDSAERVQILFTAYNTMDNLASKE